MNKLPTVAHTFIHRDNKVLLARRKNTNFHDGKYGPVGGHLEQGESIKQAAKREIQEEIGVDVVEDDLRIIGVSHYMSKSGNEGIDFFLTTNRWKGEPYAKSECDIIEWFEVGNLPENIIPFVKRAIECHFISGNWFDEIGWDFETQEFV